MKYDDAKSKEQRNSGGPEMRGNTLNVVAVGFCVGIIMILLTAAYIPGYYPEGYERLRVSGFIKFIPTLAVIQITSAVSWLYIVSMENGDE